MKSILILASSPDSGIAWIAKHADSLRDPFSHSWYTVSNTSELKHVLTTRFYNGNTTEHIDVEGYILPEFHTNPQRALMLELLINHKRRVSKPAAERFINIIDKKHYVDTDSCSE
jgi:hypothetical protein